MNTRSEPLPGDLTIPFHLRDHDGRIMVRYGVNDDPARWGMGRLRLPIDLKIAIGFPILRATITYDGQGYDAMMGWIQILDIRAQLSGKEFHVLDRFAAFNETNSPFNTFGHLPTLFDAPVIDALPESSVTFRADTYLAMIPDVGMSRRVAPVCGFGWGFAIENLRPALIEPHPLEEAAWANALSFLVQQCPDWEFLPASEP